MTSNFKEIITSDEVKDIALTLSEMTLDQIIKQTETLKDVFVLDILYKLGKTAAKIDSAFLIKKITLFLKSINEVDTKKRKSMLEKLEKNSYSKKVGEHFILLLQRADSMEKPAIYGAIFKAFCNDHIDSETLEFMNRAIDKLPVEVLPYFKSFAKTHTSPNPEDREAWGEWITLQQSYVDDIPQIFLTSGFGKLLSGPFNINIQSNRLCQLFASHVLLDLDIQHKELPKKLK